MTDVPFVIPGPLTSTTGTSGYADEIQSEAPAAGGNLAQNVTDLQALVAAVNNLPISADTQYSSIIAALLSGATVSTEHPNSRVEYTPGYNFGIDYRTIPRTGEIDLNDADHYNQDGIVITGNLAAITITIAGKTNHNRLIALKLDIDSVGRTGVGAMMVMYSLDAVTENLWMNVTSDRKIHFRTDPTDSMTDVVVSDGLGDITLNNTSSYWMLCEVIPRAGITSNYELLVSLMEIPDADPTNLSFVSANNIDLDLSSVTPGVFGVARNEDEIARVDELKHLEPTAYTSHSALSNLLRYHSADKWCWRYAQLFEGDATDKVTFATELGLPAGSTNAGGAIPKAELLVYEATGTGTAVDELVSSIVLPANYADYKYVHVTEYDATSQQWRHAEIAIKPLSSGNVTATHNVRLQGNSVMNWTLASRTLALNPLVQEIYRVALKD